MAMVPLIVRLCFKDITKPKNKRNYLIICGLIVLFFAGFRSRYSGSPDTDTYCKKFERMLLYGSFKDYARAERSSIFEDNFFFSEVGFWYSTWLLSRIFSNSMWYVFFTTAFILYGTGRFIYKNSDNAMLSLVMFITLGLFNFCMNGMRQALAMTICLYAYEFAKKKKLIPFALTIILAMLFHKSSIFAGFLYFAARFEYDFKSGVLFIALATVLIYFAKDIMVLADTLFEKEYAEEVTHAGGTMALLVYASVIGFGLLFAKKQFEKQEAVGALYFSILGAIVFSMRFVFSSGYERISYYFLYYLCILFPFELKSFESKSQGIIKAIFISFCLLLFAYRSSGTYFALCF